MCCDLPPVRKRLKVRGIVQGVGFRPFVYRLAKSLSLSGYVENTPSGVIIAVEGEGSDIQKFETDLLVCAPPLSHIIEVTSQNAPSHGGATFEIRESEHDGNKVALIPPDSDICSDCLKELFDKADRRYLYPFINCVNCGPRFTIITSVPYDRPATTMKKFEMCADCRKEYQNPEDRRFHAQPIACHNCGPSLSLRDEFFKPVATKNPLDEILRLLQDGKIVAIKGVGGYHLACDAKNSDAVKLLRHRKKRDEKPFAIMVPSIEVAKQYAVITKKEEALLKSVSKPIVLVDKKDEGLLADVAPRNRRLGILLPYTPLHHLLFGNGSLKALVMTSANVSDDPIVHTEDDAKEKLVGIADAFLVHDRPIYNRADDSIEMSMKSGPVVIRRSRGYAPTPIMLDKNYPPILALGGELKNTFCVIKDNLAFISQHIGDLKYEKSFDYFCSSIKLFLDFLDVRDLSVVALDKHPDYQNSRWGRENFPNVRKIEVQHHHAHMVSAMTERDRQFEKSIGIIFDGVGHGGEGPAWGGEFLVGDAGGFERVGFVEPVPLPGGDAAVREPWRIAVGVAQKKLWPDENFCFPWLKDITPQTVDVVQSMVARNINTPYAHGVGRLFDAASAFAGVRTNVAFEGQAAMELEGVIDFSETGCYPYKISSDDKMWQLDFYPTLKCVAMEAMDNVPAGIISARFHNTVIEGAFKMANAISAATGIKRVVLSGGVFQNRFLSDGLVDKLTASGFDVIRHSRTSPNDGGISLGQAMIAASVLG